MEASRPNPQASLRKRTLTAISTGAGVLLLDLLQLGIIGSVVTLFRTGTRWAHRRLRGQ